MKILSFKMLQYVLMLCLMGCNAKLLRILSCAHGGTTYMSALLNMSGLSLEHERLREHGIVSWKQVPLEGHFEHTFHQVRDPLKVIGSLYNREFNNDYFWNFVYLYTPINKHLPLLVRCSLYYYHWNLLAEAKSEYTYKIEHIDVEFHNLQTR